jgi:hypothetical protein
VVKEGSMSLNVVDVVIRRIAKWWRVIQAVAEASFRI